MVSDKLTTTLFDPAECARDSALACFLHATSGKWSRIIEPLVGLEGTHGKLTRARLVKLLDRVKGRPFPGG